MILVQRNGINLHGHGRNHIRRFLLKDELIERIDVDGFVADDVGSNELATSILVFESLHGDILDAWELADDALHLFQFDAETTNLHLTIATTNELDVSVRKVAHNVTRSINTSVFFFLRKWIGNKYFGSFLRTIQIAQTHLWSTNPKLTRSTYRLPASLLIHHIETHVVERLSNWNIVQVFLQRVGGCSNRALRRTIKIMEAKIGRNSQRCQFLTTH